MWWGDIIDPKTLFQPLKFLAWGLAMWCVPLKRRRALETERTGSLSQFMVEPLPVGCRGRAGAVARVRFQLFFVGYLVTVVGIVLRLILALVRAITRQNVPTP